MPKTRFGLMQFKDKIIKQEEPQLQLKQGNKTYEVKTLIGAIQDGIEKHKFELKSY